MIKFLQNFFLVPAVCIGLIFPPSVMAQPTTETGVSNHLNLEIPKFSYSKLSAGQKLTASRDVYLLSPESFARITTEYEFMQRRYELYLTERLALAKTEYDFRIDVLTQQNSFLENELERRNNLLLDLNKKKGKDLTPLWVALGFIAGSALTVGVVYALEPGVR
jgi:hypothetical protein